MQGTVLVLGELRNQVRKFVLENNTGYEAHTKMKAQMKYLLHEFKEVSFHL